MKIGIAVAGYLIMAVLYGSWSDAMDAKFRKDGRDSWVSNLGFSLAWPIMMPVGMATLAWCNHCRWSHD